MEDFTEEIENFIKSKVNWAIKTSATYNEAIMKVNRFSSLTVYGLAIKKAIQDEITNRALDNKIN